jgi:hypothetical protein
VPALPADPDHADHHHHQQPDHEERTPMTKANPTAGEPLGISEANQLAVSTATGPNGSNSDPMATRSLMNPGNRRTGVARGRSGRPGSLKWRVDPVVLERVDLVRSLAARGYTTAEMLPVVVAWCGERGILPVSMSTLHADRGRARELLAEERAETAGTEQQLREGHLEALRELQRQAWIAFLAADARSANRAGFLSVIRASRETMAKLDGSYAPARVRVTTDQENGDEIERIRLLMETAVPDVEQRRALALRIVRDQIRFDQQGPPR